MVGLLERPPDGALGQALAECVDGTFSPVLGYRITVETGGEKIDYGTMKIAPAPAPAAAAAAAAAAGAPLYASVEGRVASLANGEVLFYDPATDRNHVMTAQVLQALSLCRQFQPM